MTWGSTSIPKGHARIAQRFNFNVRNLSSPRCSPEGTAEQKIRRAAALVLYLLISSSTLSQAEIQLLPDREPTRVFSGADRPVVIQLHNTSGKSANLDLRARLYQASSCTAAVLNNAQFGKLQILPRQTIIESIPFTFPAVRAETPFVIQWLDAPSNVIGTTSLLVYPPDLLKELKTLAANDPVGLFDPDNQLKPLLQNLHIEFVDLEDSGLEPYQGKLAVLGPFHSKEQLGPMLPSLVRPLARKGTGVIWIQPPAEPHARLKPSFYSVIENKVAILVAQPSLVTNLSTNPQSQLNLLELARLAVKPPDFSSAPKLNTEY